MSCRSQAFPYCQSCNCRAGLLCRFWFDGRVIWLWSVLRGSSCPSPSLHHSVQLMMQTQLKKMTSPGCLVTRSVRCLKQAYAQQGGAFWGLAVVKFPSLTSLVVQWFRICLATQEMQVRALVCELRSHIPQSD